MRLICLFRCRYTGLLLTFLLTMIMVTGSCRTTTETDNDPAPVIPSGSVSQDMQDYTYRIVNVFPHDSEAFTQGLVFSDGMLYEGTGLNGRSSIRRVELETGEVVQKYELPDKYFGEGIVVFGETIVQLTWKSGTGFIYDRESFSLIREFSYDGEGWGITDDGEQLIMSDGSAVLIFLDRKTFEPVGSIPVHDEGVPIDQLNELEYIDGKVFVNIWQTDKIAVIEPETGQVSGWIDLSGLLETQQFTGHTDVLNGIAYDTKADRLFVTGKLWPYLFEIKLVPE